MRQILAMVSLLLASAAHAADSNPLAWLAGCWSTPDGNSVKDGRVTFYETLTIRVADLGYVYTARPRKQRSAAFPVDDIGHNTVRFANMNHDYPQAIEYRLEGETLIAETSLIDGSGKRRFEKVRCELLDAQTP